VPRLRGITGSATNAYTPSLGQQFTVITAAGGISGSFSSLSQPAGLPAGTRFDALYAPTTLTLAVTPQSYGALPAAGLSETTSEMAVGRALDSVRPIAGERMTAAQSALFMPLYALNGSNIAPALNQMSPVIYSDGEMAARDTWYQIADSIEGQFAARRDGAVGTNTAPGPSGSIIWTTAIGQSIDVATSGPPGYHTTIAGAVAGIDVPVKPFATIGAAVGGASAKTSNNGSSDTGAAVQFAAYGEVRYERLFLDGQVDYMHVDRSVRRDLGFADTAAKGDGQANGGGGQIQGGIRLPYRGWTFEPTIGRSAFGLDTGSIGETDGAGFAERIDAQSVGSLQSLAAIRAEHQFAVTRTLPVRVSALVGWQHAFLDVAPTTSASFSTLGSSSFSANPAPISRDAAKLGAGVDFALATRLTVYGAYQQLIGARWNAESLTAGLRFAW
jgi:outer membrane autotransporter protein